MSALTAGGMTHAWLITGPPGSGRSVAAVCFAAALQCTSEGVPGCGECRACTTTMAGTHADVRRIIPEGLSIAVKEMREIVQIASRRPGTGRWQIVVVEDAAAADPAHLAAVATALVAVRGRLLLIDSGEPGPGRRLLDGPGA